ncbi:cytosolic phospholipase A2 gamma-like [Colossoma macropomum]|uniref:cytosolic phospholipase A2 gamma-like n=1 Tax=Colossoma macropomum TaxID=42526 RepID=UPI0018655C38|nr:cytosolic phospholipase A2 gamma-like [Colossoma macropomum]
MYLGSSKVRIGHSLNEAERQHVIRRRKTVLQCLQKHNIHCSLDEVPNIAVLGSGGGLRAMVALLGSLSELKDQELLDCIMYLSGVSGSTWCMTSLYKEADWSTKLDTVKNNIVQRLANGKVNWLDKYYKLKKYLEHDNFSLTDVWAVLLVSYLVKEIDENTLTKQRGKCTNDPYPIYTVIDKQRKQSNSCFSDVWFEITPDESGYSLSGAFVDSSCLGSQFENGKKITDQPEMDMLYLQGLCGSAIADLEEDLKIIFQEIIHFFFPTNTQERNASQALDVQKGRQVLPTLVELNLCVLRQEDPTVKLKAMDDLLRDTAECITKLLTWTWGTTYNFLYNMKVEEVDPSVLHSKTREYEDSGVLLNSPYFSVLRKERDIDLIISLDFSTGDPFQTVEDAAKMCEELHIPFPKVTNIDDATREAPQDFYVFEGSGEAPTVIHIPLFNVVNCNGDIKEWEERYSWRKREYSLDDSTGLMEKAYSNITNNKGNLIKEIKHVIERKKSLDKLD